MKQKIIAISIIILILTAGAASAWSWDPATWVGRAFKVGDGKDIDLNGNSIGNGNMANIECQINCNGFNPLTNLTGYGANMSIYESRERWNIDNGEVDNVITISSMMNDTDIWLNDDGSNISFYNDKTQNITYLNLTKNGSYSIFKYVNSSNSVHDNRSIILNTFIYGTNGTNFPRMTTYLSGAASVSILGGKIVLSTGAAANDSKAMLNTTFNISAPYQLDIMFSRTFSGAEFIPQAVFGVADIANDTNATSIDVTGTYGAGAVWQNSGGQMLGLVDGTLKNPPSHVFTSNEIANMTINVTETNAKFYLGGVASGDYAITNSKPLPLVFKSFKNHTSGTGADYKLNIYHIYIYRHNETTTITPALESMPTRPYYFLCMGSNSVIFQNKTECNPDTP